MDEIYIFDKSFHDRLQECSDILSSEDIPASQIQKEWSCFLEIVIDHSGWQSLWKIPRIKCNDLGISYPNLVLVYVQSIDFEQLTASVKVLAVQDDISIPEIVTVSLINLYPTKKQDELIALNMPTTAEMVDLLRFFYNHVWMPWDSDDDCCDWPKKYLESRIRLYYDMKCGIIPRPSAEYIWSLINEAKLIKHKLETIENEFEDFEDIKVEKSDKVEALTKLHLRFSQIKSEMDVFENPGLRSVLLKSHDKRSEHSKNIEYWIVIKEGTIMNIMNYLDDFKSKVPNDSIVQPAVNIHDALERANPGDYILIGSGTHPFQSIGNFECGGTITSINSNTETILKYEHEDGKVMFDFSGLHLLLENLTIDICNSTCAILVRRGTVTLKNCILICESNSFNRQGIIALHGSVVNIENCQFKGFSSAIVANLRSKVVIVDSLISHCDIGIKFYDDSIITVKNTSITDCRTYGLCLETTKYDVCFECIEKMNSITEVEITSTTIENNKHNTAIVQKPSNIFDLIDAPNCELPSENKIMNEEIHSMDCAM